MCESKKKSKEKKIIWDTEIEELRKKKHQYAKKKYIAGVMMSTIFGLSWQVTFLLSQIYECNLKGTVFEQMPRFFAFAGVPGTLTHFFS